MKGGEALSGGRIACGTADPAFNQAVGGVGLFAQQAPAAAYPNKVAAIVPISGRTDLTKACLVKDIPAWVFHGDNDPTVNDDYSIDFVNAVKNCLPRSATPKLTFLYTKKSQWME